MTRSAWDNLQTAGRQGYQGLTLGFGDELIDAPTAAIVAALTKQKFGDVYKEARGISRNNLARDWKEAPITSFASNVIGSAPLALSAPAAELSNWARGSSLLGALGKGATVGAGYGAVTGAGSASADPNASLADTLMARTSGAGWGAALGSVLGATGSALGRYFAPADNVDFSKVGKTVSKPEVTRAQKLLAEQLGARPDLQEQLARAEAMNTASQNTGIDLTLAEKIAQSQSDPLLAQQKILGGNPQTAGAMEALYANRSGTPNQAGQIENALTQKAQELAPGVGSYDDAALSLIDKSTQAAQNITKKLSAQASPLYEEAFSKKVPPNMMTNLQNKHPIIENAIKAARADERFSAPLQGLPDNSIEVIDAAKRIIDEKVRAGANPAAPFDTRAYKTALNDLLGIADQYAPSYGQARAIYSGNPDALQMRQAIGNVADVDPLQAKQVAQKLFSGTQQNAEMASQALGPEGSKLAAAARIYDVMDTAKGDPTSFAGKIAPDSRTNDMLRTYAGGNQLDDVLNVINQAKIGEKFRYGSPTQPLQEANSVMKGAAGAGMDLATGNKLGVVKKIAGMFGRGEDPQFYQDMMNLMTTDQGMDLVRRVASGQGTAIEKQQSANALIQSLQQPSAAIETGIRNAATLGINAPQSQVFQPDSPQASGLPPGFTKVQNSTLPEGFVKIRRQ